MDKRNKEHGPQVSVVLTTYYYRPAALSRAIESILNQIFTDFEFIIVNDGAIDDTKKMLNNYAQKDSRIQVLHQKNKGLGEARNLGVRHARGAYIAFMDDDDQSLPTRLEEQVNFLHQHPQFVACVCYYYIVAAKCQENQEWYLRQLKHDDKTYSKEQLKNILPPPFSLSPITMITKEAFEDCGGYRALFQVNEDLDFTLRFQEKFQVAVVPKPLYVYTRPESDFGKNMTTEKPIQNLKYVLACYISAWYRRNTGKDPVDQNADLDEVIHMGGELPKQTRLHILYECSKYPINVCLSNPNLSAADVLALFQVLRKMDDRGDLRFLYRKIGRLLVKFTKERRIGDLLCLVNYTLRWLVRSKLN